MSVYIAAHKQFALPAVDAAYKVLQVGAYKGHIFSESPYAVYDDCGDNISIKNQSFCELTGIYWIWKNTTDDYVGLVHYRRYFTKALNGAPLSEKDIKRTLTKYDAILPFHRVLSVSVRENFCETSGYEKDLDLTGQIIKELYPEYFSDFQTFFDEKNVYFANMFVMKRSLFDAYCEWLFNIMFELEKRVDTTNYSQYYSRIYGFISERLLGVYLIHNHIKCCECSVIATEETRPLCRELLIKCKRVLGFSRPGLSCR